MCSHRGAIITPEGSGVARRHTCPYHAWSYDVARQPRRHLRRRRLRGDRSRLQRSDAAGLRRAGRPGVDLPRPRAIDRHRRVSCAATTTCSSTCGSTSVTRSVGSRSTGRTGRSPTTDISTCTTSRSSTARRSDRRCPARPCTTRGDHTSASRPRTDTSGSADRPESDWPLEALIGGVWDGVPHVSIAAFDKGRLIMVSILSLGR